MKDVFKEKYLEYDPSITLEIFTLVWNRLIELGYKSFNNYTVEERYGEFKGLYKYFRTTQDHPNEFNCYNNGNPYSETTVEEILGYNPFIKETIPSKDWNKVTEEELLEEAKRRYPIGCKIKLISRNIGGDFKNEVRFTMYKTFDYSKGKQLFVDGNLLLFHEGVWAEIESLPEVEVKDETKEVIPEYIECIKPQSCYFIPGIVYKVLDTECRSSCKIISNIKCSHYEANNTLYVSLSDTSYFKPSTKEAYDEQVSKEPTKEEVKQPLKQVVHCTTQEEWDFVLSKLPKSSFLSEQSDRFTKYNDHYRHEGGIAVNINDCAYSGIGWYKNEGYQILTFQEWCNLNGYKMEKKVEFEAGKWYSIKTTHNWIIKFKEIKDGNIRADWYCLNERGKKVEEGGYWWAKPTEIKELSIEEIQQYLPEEHPDKIKSDIKFEVGDWVVSVERSLSYDVKEICRVSKISKTRLACENKPQGESNMKPFDKFRHATPEEINSHLISIGQIPVGEPLNTGIEPNKDNSYSCISINRGENPQCTFNSIKLNGQEILKPKMILSIDDEELPMVNIIKTNSIKQLLNND